MQKNTVDKRKSKTLNKNTRGKYKAMVKVCESSAEHFKNQAAVYEGKFKECGVVIEYYEHKISNIKYPDTGPDDQDPTTCEALNDICDTIEYSQAIIQQHKDMAAGYKNIIRLCKRQALVYERREKKYKDLLLVKRSRE